MREFSKKKQDGIVSTMKINVLNRILSDVREIVAGDDTITYLDRLDEDVCLWCAERSEETDSLLQGGALQC